MDETPPRLENGHVRVHPALHDLYPRIVELGVLSATRPPEVGGQRLPMTVASLAAFYLMAANLSAYAYLGLTTGAARLVESFGSDELKERFMTRMYNGEWTGTWGSYNPSQGTTPPKDICKRLDCKVEYKDGVWNAIFEGDCGRPYKYTIKMEGRQVGKVVMFKGTTDLGAKDGGVFDWIGRANEKEFVGFFTSGYYTGTFSLTKKQAQ